MFPRNLLLMLLYTCILSCHFCNAQETSTASDAVIISTAMVCAMFSVIIILVPTVLYYRYYAKKEEIEEQ
ncbi:hypothetical protein PUN28_002780 [Cardiocondyla obscurior]|uniref:Photosystem II protein M n=1 Tax=Cardiocondyla obscurior TaxID=286306 RepID=A0AAW2GW91_9HYME